MSAICFNELSNYNHGKLVFKWFNLDLMSSAEEFYNSFYQWLHGIKDPCTGQPCEEVNIADAEEIPEIFYGNYSFNADKFFQYRELADEVGEDKLNAYLDIFGELPDDADAINERYFDFIDYNTDDTTGFYIEVGYMVAEYTGIDSELPEYIKNYFNYESYGRDAYIDNLRLSNKHLFWIR